jgi:hypothetical protein
MTPSSSLSLQSSGTGVGSSKMGSRKKNAFTMAEVEILVNEELKTGLPA